MERYIFILRYTDFHHFYSAFSEIEEKCLLLEYAWVIFSASRGRILQIQSRM